MPLRPIYPSKGQIEGILKSEHGLEYALVAIIVSAQKTAIEIAESEDNNHKAVQVNTESDIFIIKGKLIDMLCLDDITGKESEVKQ